MGIPVKRSHAIRRTVAGRLSLAGLSDLEIMGILRHSNPETTRNCYLYTMDRGQETDALIRKGLETAPVSPVKKQISAPIHSGYIQNKMPLGPPQEPLHVPVGRRKNVFCRNEAGFASFRKSSGSTAQERPACFSCRPFKSGACRCEWR